MSATNNSIFFSSLDDVSLSPLRLSNLDSQGQAQPKSFPILLQPKLQRPAPFSLLEPAQSCPRTFLIQELDFSFVSNTALKPYNERTSVVIDQAWAHTSTTPISYTAGHTIHKDAWKARVTPISQRNTVSPVYQLLDNTSPGSSPVQKHSPVAPNKECSHNNTNINSGTLQGPTPMVECRYSEHGFNRLHTPQGSSARSSFDADQSWLHISPMEGYAQLPPMMISDQELDQIQRRPSTIIPEHEINHQSNKQHHMQCLMQSCSQAELASTTLLTFNQRLKQEQSNKENEFEGKEFACSECDKIYKGKNARSILRRHLKDKHKIEQPRGTRWDNDPNRPKTDEERRQRMLESKRRSALKARERKNNQRAIMQQSNNSQPGSRQSDLYPASKAELSLILSPPRTPRNLCSSPVHYKIQRMKFESLLKSNDIKTPQMSHSSLSSPGTSKTFSFVAPHYKDFVNDVTLGEGDSFFGSAIRLTSCAIGRQPLFTPSKKVSFTPILNEINGLQHRSSLINSKEDNDAKIIIEKLTIKSPLREPKKIKFLESNPNIKDGADKDNVSPVIKVVKGAVNKANSKPTNITKQITIPKEFNFSKRLDKPLRVKNYPTRKSQGIRKRQPVKKLGTDLTVPKPFRFHMRNRSNAINKYSPKSPFISLAERIQQFLEKTPDRFKSKVVAMKPASNYVNPPTKAKSPFLRTKLRAEKIKLLNKEKEKREVNNDKVKSKPVNSSNVKSGRVKITKPEITIPISPLTTRTKPLKQKLPSSPHIVKANPVSQFKEPFKPVVTHRKMDLPKYSLPGEEISQHKAEIREAKLKKEAREQEEARKFKARPLPSDSPDTLPPVSPLPTTETKPFKLRTEIRGEKYQQSFRETITKLNKREKEDLLFRAKPVPNLSPYQPKKSDKPLTEIVEFNLHADARLEKRKAYDEQRNLREQEEKILKEQKQREEEVRNQQQIRRLRTELVHHAQPIKRFAPIKIEYTNRKVTKPVSPLIGEKRRQKLQALKETNIRNVMAENVSTAKIVPQSKNNNRKLPKRVGKENVSN
ncbi:hypothetical protein C1645_817957 [Glomus cerebriforme]|uniref:TPX2 C-terminal domain-containing protein n=1 Tax=Glomus cerebriforme TaxID=658196 RepID=A0A397TDR2_9GLOM|nr:hypothetical protein C1645_817957 [Glomus cerebriforme]